MKSKELYVLTEILAMGLVDDEVAKCGLKFVKI